MKLRFLVPVLALVLAFGLAGCGGDDEEEASTDWPAAGDDVFESTTATVEIELTEEGAAARGIRLTQTETIELQGPTTVTRSDPELDGDVYVVTTEVVEMELRGTASFGEVIVRESPDQQSLGEVRQAGPGEDSGASSFFDIYVEVEVPQATASASVMQAGMVLHNEEPLHMEATLSDLPPGEGDEYRGEDDRPLYTPAALEVGRIVDALHIPVPEGEDGATEEPTESEGTEPGGEPSATEPSGGGGQVETQVALGCQHVGPGESRLLVAVYVAGPDGQPIAGATVNVSATGPGLVDSSGSATTNAQGVAQVVLGINAFGDYTAMIDSVTTADGPVDPSTTSETSGTYTVGENCTLPSFT
jgi:hypothetical protein